MVWKTHKSNRSKNYKRIARVGMSLVLSKKIKIKDRRACGNPVHWCRWCGILRILTKQIAQIMSKPTAYVGKLFVLKTKKQKNKKIKTKTGEAVQVAHGCGPARGWCHLWHPEPMIGSGRFWVRFDLTWFEAQQKPERVEHIKVNWSPISIKITNIKQTRNT